MPTSGGQLERSTPMEIRLYRFVTRSAFGVMVALAAPSAWAQQVDLTQETHFRCYIVSHQTPQPSTLITLSDQFLQDVSLEIDEPLQFCAPVSKNGATIEKPEEHLTMYPAAANLAPELIVNTLDQFGPRTLKAVGARVLFVPTQKQEVNGVATDLDFPNRLNHDWCYQVNGPSVDQDVTLSDQIRPQTETVRVEEPVLFCNPVEKRHDRVRARIVEREVHLTCYDIHAPQSTNATQVAVLNQFESDIFTITSFQLLCVPAEKISFEPVP
jgi:hypothetical protein